MAPSASALSHAAPMSTADHTNMELEESALDSTPVDSATAAAAAAMSDLSDQSAAAIAGRLHGGRRVHRCAPLSLLQYDAHGYCAHECAGAPLADAGSGPRMNEFGQQLCEHCTTRLNRAKGKLHLHPPGKICHSCYMKAQRSPSAAVDATPVRTHKRKAGSDPGQPAPAAAEPLNRTRLRVRAPRVEVPPSPPPAKKAHSIPANVSLLLDQAHARRMAAAAAAQPSAPSALHNAVVDEEKAEMAARTPAQWARRGYLQNIAPRCERCNFPRTRRKGWNEKTGCHTDKDCNNNRWRTIDLLC
jgi:hypothetical protein